MTFGTYGEESEDDNSESEDIEFSSYGFPDNAI